MLRLDGSSLCSNTLAECKQAVQFLLENPEPAVADVPGANSADVTVEERPTTSSAEVGHTSSDLPCASEMHWLIDPLVNKYFATHSVVARFLPGHQRAGQLVWTFSDSRTHITSVTLAAQSKLDYSIDMEYTSKNFGVTSREQIFASDVTVAGPTVNGLALVVSGAHKGKLCVVKTIIRDPQTKSAIAFKVKFDGARRGQVVDVPVGEITRAQLLPANTLT